SSRAVERPFEVSDGRTWSDSDDATVHYNNQLAAFRRLKRTQSGNNSGASSHTRNHSRSCDFSSRFSSERLGRPNKNASRCCPCCTARRQSEALAESLASRALAYSPDISTR